MGNIQDLLNQITIDGASQITNTNDAGTTNTNSLNNDKMKSIFEYSHIKIFNESSNFKNYLTLHKLLEYKSYLSHFKNVIFYNTNINLINVFPNCNELTMIKVHINDDIDIDPNAIKNVQSIIYRDKLNKLPILNYFTNLKDLSLIQIPYYDNPINFFASTAALKNLESLTLNYVTNIVSLDISEFQKLKKLVLIDLPNLQNVSGILQSKTLKTLNVSLIDYSNINSEFLFDLIKKQAENKTSIENLELGYSYFLDIKKLVENANDKKIDFFFNRVKWCDTYSASTLLKTNTTDKMNTVLEKVDDFINKAQIKKSDKKITKIIKLYKFVISTLKYHSNIEKQLDIYEQFNDVYYNKNSLKMSSFLGKHNYLTAPFNFNSKSENYEEVVCEGFAKFLSFALNRVGIKSSIIPANSDIELENNFKKHCSTKLEYRLSTADHQIVLVELDNKYLYLDPTSESSAYHRNNKFLGEYINHSKEDLDKYYYLTPALPKNITGKYEFSKEELNLLENNESTLESNIGLIL